ncbi:hypothetical protein Ae706Ps2_4837c [Pseudonocardia sp. Ae706_Ps2]|nr:hypothetical protein Ae706Ps2_4832c [Pseudonocardia sp. Ae706_Ps2]OLM26404.1 hypothetical protein Ae706Ps2_4837c [Pseudonocardia sp. Ae706_Ps2]
MTVSICAGPNRSTGVLPRSRSSHHPRRVATTSHPATENTSLTHVGQWKAAMSHRLHVEDERNSGSGF